MLTYVEMMLLNSIFTETLENSQDLELLAKTKIKFGCKKDLNE